MQAGQQRDCRETHSMGFVGGGAQPLCNRRFGLLAGLLLLVGAAPAMGEPKEDELTEIVVTGSHFASPNATSPSPIAVIDSEELQHQGATRAEELLNSLPQLNSGLTIAANGAGVAPLTGTATADLRGIGAFRTLVLVNGLRTAPGDPTNPSADLNTVPTALIKRVEVLTGGASAIYGSDAIAGVVNFILDTDFSGFKLDVEGGINRGTNSRGDLQSIARASRIVSPTGSTYDGRAVDASAVFGTDLFGGAGHVTAYAGYRQARAISGSRRDFSTCTLLESVTSYDCILDGTTAAGQFVPNGGAGPSLTLDNVSGNTFRAFDPILDGYNPAPLQSLQRPDRRVNAGVFASYKFSEAVNLYSEAQYTDDRTSVLYEPSGTTATGSALNVFGVNCNNPLLSASQFQSLCADYGLGLADMAQVGIGRRNIEGGQRQDEFRHKSYRLVAGLKGALNDAWSYDTSVLYGRVTAHEQLSNDVSQSRLANALNVVSVGGVPTCQSVVDGSDPNCVPYNIYSVGGVSGAALRYIAAGGSQRGYAERAIVSGKLIGELDKYGWKSPYAKDAVEVALGMEHRTESVSYTQDAAYSSGDLLATGSARPTQGSFHVSELFTELRVPLVSDKPFAKRVTLNLSDRYARYSPQGAVNAYGVGLDWSPIEPVRLRGSVSRAIRAPNGHELFLSDVLSQFPATDPCANDPVTGVPAATAAQCARTGVTAAQYGNIAAAQTVNQVTGGNRGLKPETADTFTAGVVLTPLDTLTFSADYWRIRVKQFTGSLAAGDSLNNCISTGDPIYCALIQRDANGSLSTGNGPTAGRIIATTVNTGSYGTSGVDFEGRYNMNLGGANSNAGRIVFSFSGSIALNNPIEVVPGRASFDCTGLFGPTCTGEGPTSPVPRWRHKLRATWQPGNGIELSVNWRHIGQLKSEFTSSNPHLSKTVYAVDARVPAYDYLDADLSYDLPAHITVRVGVNNVTDRQPPIVGFNANPLLLNGNLVAGSYDFLGRYLFIGVSAKY